MGTAQGGARVSAGIRAGGATPASFPKAWTFSGMCAGIDTLRKEAMSPT
jgi:hypothetical protein